MLRLEGVPPGLPILIGLEVDGLLGLASRQRWPRTPLDQLKTVMSNNRLSSLSLSLLPGQQGEGPQLCGGIQCQTQFLSPSGGALAVEESNDYSAHSLIRSCEERHR